MVGKSPKKEMRKCLRCQKDFPSTGPGNRICDKCNSINSNVRDVQRSRSESIQYRHGGVKSGDV